MSDDRYLDDEYGRRPLPPRWVQLIEQVGLARTRNQCDPANPLHEIGRFGAIVVVGVGGYGIVFEARDPELDRHVALKLCLTPGPEAAEAITREAKLLAKLSHPNIITAYEIGRYGDDVFFVMELVRAKTGESIILEDPPLSWRKVVEIYRAIAAGLAAAHDAGIVHGDFKPGNVVLDEQYWPRVADFGLAQLLVDHGPEAQADELERQHGTLLYMAPEKLRGRLGDALSDQWSYCMSLWQTLAGLLPFGGDTPEDLLTAIDDREARPTRLGMPPAVRMVLSRGLSAEPSERYPDMHALVRELDGLIRQPTTTQPSEPPTSEAVRPTTEAARPLRGIFFAAMLITCGAGLGGGVMAVARPAVEPDAAAIESDDVDSLDERPSERTRLTVEEVIADIEMGNIEEAGAAWQAEFDTRAAAAEPRAADSFQIAEAFLRSATALKDRNPTKSKIAARKAIVWADQTSERLRQEEEKGRGSKSHALRSVDANDIADAAEALLANAGG